MFDRDRACTGSVTAHCLFPVVTESLSPEVQSGKAVFFKKSVFQEKYPSVLINPLSQQSIITLLMFVLKEWNLPELVNCHAL